MTAKAKQEIFYSHSHTGTHSSFSLRGLQCEAVVQSPTGACIDLDSHHREKQHQHLKSMGVPFRKHSLLDQLREKTSMEKGDLKRWKFYLHNENKKINKGSLLCQHSLMLPLRPARGFSICVSVCSEREAPLAWLNHIDSQDDYNGSYLFLEWEILP